MKWKSTLFSALDNKLGDQIVGARWKGRGYFRSYVIPANPNSLKQQAERDDLRNLVSRYQAIAPADSDERAAWDAEALPLAISGYNLFCKYGRPTEISCPSTGTSGVAFDVTYTLGMPIDRAELYTLKDTTVAKATYTGSLEAGTGKTKSVTITGTGTYGIFVGDKNVIKTGDTPGNAYIYQLITKWKPNPATGVADPADIVIS
jgi:hypothetical protein